MTLSNEQLEKLASPKPGPITSRLPGKFARTNAALIAGVKKKAIAGSLKA
jgi:hypothetical protein